jgi:PIN domain nuclease of toxin-antitoxin system
MNALLDTCALLWAAALLDACALLWAARQPERLSAPVRALLLPSDRER